MFFRNGFFNQTCQKLGKGKRLENFQLQEPYNYALIDRVQQKRTKLQDAYKFTADICGFFYTSNFVFFFFTFK